MSFWNVAKWVGLAVVVLALAVMLARIFSGPEDTWVRDAAGRWVAHGHPASPPPSADYRAPWHERVLPWLIIGLAVVGLAGGALLSARSPATRGDLGWNVRFFGAVSIVAFVLATALAVALGLTLASASGGEMSNETLLVVLALLGVAGLLVLFGLHAHGTKKLLEAHYDLKRTAALLQETVEGLAQSLANTGRARQ